MLKLYVAAMNKLASVKNFFAKKEEGASLVEYGLLVGLIAAVCIATIGLLGGDIKSLFTKVESAVNGAAANVP